MASPSTWPGSQFSRMPCTWPTHGIAIGPPLWITTIVCGFAAATAETSAFWSSGEYVQEVGEAKSTNEHVPECASRSGRSAPSISASLTNTTATSAAPAAATASSVTSPSA